MSRETSSKYGIDPKAVYLVGHSMGGNSVINAAARDVSVCGVALIAPCDIGYMAERMTKKELTAFLVGEGLHVLHRKSDEAVVEDILANASAMRFANASKSVGGRKLFLATGDYDVVVPSEPLDALWQQLPSDSKRHVRIRYRADHSLMGVRRALAKALSDFILN
jgi:pimeloyl-ACP methyl ester carboxylesterase